MARDAASRVALTVPGQLPLYFLPTSSLAIHLPPSIQPYEHVKPASVANSAFQWYEKPQLWPSQRIQRAVAVAQKRLKLRLQLPSQSRKNRQKSVVAHRRPTRLLARLLKEMIKVTRSLSVAAVAHARKRPPSRKPQLHRSAPHREPKRLLQLSNPHPSASAAAVLPLQ